MVSMTTVYLALGTNEGDRLANLRRALTLLAQSVQVQHEAGVYETAAAYVEDQPPFYNTVVCGTTTLAPHDLLAALKAIELEMGRTAGVRYGPRPIDLDILLYADLVLHTPTLTIPHPRLAERAFVLRPLADIAPDLIIPGAGATVAQLAQQAEVGAVLRRVTASVSGQD